MLQGCMRCSGGSRLVSVASIGHRRSDIECGDIEYHRRADDRWQVYGLSKTTSALRLWDVAGQMAGF